MAFCAVIECSYDRTPNHIYESQQHMGVVVLLALMGRRPYLMNLLQQCPTS